MKNIYSYIIASLITLSFSQIASATDVTVNPATITILSGGSTSDAQGVALSSGTVPGACSNRFYIDPTDKELFETALAVAMANKTVALRVAPGSTTMYLDPHGTTNCRIVAIFW